jgi:large subunit ribosomal protein L18e
MAKPGPKSNDELVALLSSLRKASRTQKAPIWHDVAERLQGPAQGWAEVNVSRLARVAPKGATVLVPGKVLGAGALGHPITVAAFQFTASAREKIAKAGGTPLTIGELMEKSPKGSGVKIVA